MKKPIVVCGVCNNKMKIEEWMFPFGFDWPQDTQLPHMNRAHPCCCGKLWMSTDSLDYKNGIIIWEACS